MISFLHKIFCRPFFAKKEEVDIKNQPKLVERESIYKKHLIDFFQEELVQSVYIESSQIRRIIMTLLNNHFDLSKFWGQELTKEQKQRLGYNEKVYISDIHLQVLTEQATSTKKTPKEIFDQLWKQSFLKYRNYSIECLLENNIEKVKISLVVLVQTRSDIDT